jgi:hypothetical protein
MTKSSGLVRHLFDKVSFITYIVLMYRKRSDFLWLGYCWPIRDFSVIRIFFSGLVIAANIFDLNILFIVVFQRIDHIVEYLN